MLQPLRKAYLKGRMTEQFSIVTASKATQLWVMVWRWCDDGGGTDEMHSAQIMIIFLEPFSRFSGLYSTGNQKICVTKF